MLPQLKKEFPVKFFKMRENVGYCSAANLAIQDSSGEYLCIIDHDIEMTPLVIRELVASLESDSSVGAVQPKIVNAYDKRLVDSYDINESGCTRGMEAALYTCSRKILYCVGACCVIRRKTFHQVGGFYDDFFVDKQDVDFGWRLWLYGYTVKSVPGVEVYHSRGILRNKEQINPIFEYNSFKNQIVMVVQNFETENLVRFLSRFVLITFFTLLRKPSRGYVQIKSYFWVVSHLKMIMKRRYSVQSSRKIADDKLLGMLKHVFPKPITEYLRLFFMRV
jgi:hypothetical protein